MPRATLLAPGLSLTIPTGHSRKETGAGGQFSCGSTGEGAPCPPRQHEARKGFCLPEAEEGWEPGRAQG